MSKKDETWTHPDKEGCVRGISCHTRFPIYSEKIRREEEAVKEN